MTETAIRTSGLGKVYTVGDSRVEALNGVDLSVDRGCFVAVTGPSGCGKSTLLHLLGGLDFPTSGEVWINGICLNKCREKELAKARCEEIGYVFQNFSLIEELNVRENIVLPVLLAKRKVDTDLVDDLVKKLGIEDRLNFMPSQLSGGQQQRVAIARALVNDPSVILCDEPTGNLDRKNGQEVIELLHSVHEAYKKTIVVVTHDKTIAEGAERVVRMEDGCILG